VIGRELKSSPLEGQEANYIKYGEQYKVDPLLLTAISFHESSYCKAYAGWHNDKYHNCAGIMNGGQENGLVAFNDYASFIERHAKLISSYIYKDGRDSVSEIGVKYAPVASHFLNQSWIGSVSKKYHQLWLIVDKK